MESITYTDTITKGHSECPACKSDSWKSAKMIVMEGTTKIEGKIGGTSTDPGAFSGNTRNLLLSDRWFSWDQEIELEADLTSVNGLVEEVKRLMVTHAPLSAMPVEPRELPIPVKPQCPYKPSLVTVIEPKSPPEEPVKPKIPSEPIDRSWYENFMFNIYVSIFFTILIVPIFYYTLEKVAIGITRFTAAYAILFAKNFGLDHSITSFLKNNPSELKYGTLAIFTIILALIPINLVKSFSGNKQQKREHKKNIKEIENNYIKSMSEYKIRLSEYNMAVEKAKEQELENIKQQEIYNTYEIEYKRSLRDYENLIKNRALEVKKMRHNYESQLDKVIRHRELLWARARVCLRCGTGYIGEDDLNPYNSERQHLN